MCVKYSHHYLLSAPERTWVVSTFGSVLGSAMRLWMSSISGEWGEDGQCSKAIRILIRITVGVMLGKHFHPFHEHSKKLFVP